ncbi:MAG: metal transporter [Syntrophobacteraceae bacterium]
MQNYFNAPYEMFSAAASLMCKSMQVAPKLGRAAFAQTMAAQDYWNGMFRHVTAFMAPSVNALNAFTNTEKEKLPANSPAENLEDYSELFKLNVGLAGTAMTGSLRAMNSFFYSTLSKGFLAWMNSFEDEDSLNNFASRLREVLKVTVHEYPKAIEEIKAEFGFHLDNGGYLKVAETERFEVYQVLPSLKAITPRSKPILIVPPYALGANILAFLPGEQKSYVHCYANQGVPTYVRLVKDIDTTAAVRTMTGEDDALDIRFFCQELLARHNRPVTLNGFCQGGLLTLNALLSGEVDGLVDAMITCVTPVDGSRSKGLVNYMKGIPPRFRDIKYSEKMSPDGNTVIDGSILSWVYKLQNLESESPIASFHRDIAMFDSQATPRPRIAKTAAAISYWLYHGQKDIPVNITKMSFDSYSTPIDEEGTLPFTLFGRKLNVKRIEEKKTPWLICIADGDDLVDKEASLAALDYIDAEVCVFPKGHASIATSWSIPTSTCALHLRFPQPGVSQVEPPKMCRGPVRFQMDLDEAIDAAARCCEAKGDHEAEPDYPGTKEEAVETILEALVEPATNVDARGQQLVENRNWLVGEEVKIESASPLKPLVLVPPTRKAAMGTKTGAASPKRRTSRKTTASQKAVK